MVPPEAQLLLQQPDVLLNLFIATGLTGAITKTPSHSAAPQLPRGFVCVITRDNASQYFMFNFKTLIGMTGSWNSQRMCTCTSKLQGSCRLFSRKQIYLSSSHWFLSAVWMISVVFSCLFTTVTAHLRQKRSQVQMSSGKVNVHVCFLARAEARLRERVVFPRPSRRWNATFGDIWWHLDEMDERHQPAWVWARMFNSLGS